MFSLEPRHLFLEIRGPIMGICVYPRRVINEFRVVFGGKPWRSSDDCTGDLDRLPPILRNVIDIIRVLDDGSPVEAYREVVQQVRPENVIVVQPVIPGPGSARPGIAWNALNCRDARLSRRHVPAI